MWGDPPIFVPEGFSVVVRNLVAAEAWYREKLGMQNGPSDIEDDSGLPAVALQLGKHGEWISLLENNGRNNGNATGGVRAMFFAKNLDKAREWILSRGIVAEPLQRDSGGNQFFVFQDLDGNRLEVCEET